MEIVPAAEADVVPGPEDWFTGEVRMERVVGTGPATTALRVTFQPGARTAWHTHPHGQTLLVLDGVARVGTEGGEPTDVEAGGKVTFEAGERHFHGAAPGAPMTHLALQPVGEDGATTQWQEHVSDGDFGD
jgi:quercetin dioxygenase-like cupin family protein